MTQEEKDLLLKDLSARLPHGIVVHYKGLARPIFGIEPTKHCQITLDNALDGEHNGLVYVSLDVDGEYPKPYLRPMSSMTRKERSTYITLLAHGPTSYTVAWLDAKHFDHRVNKEGDSLIALGLAIEVTKDNNPYKD